jgi:hypothetical protein
MAEVEMFKFLDIHPAEKASADYLNTIVGTALKADPNFHYSTMFPWDLGPGEDNGRRVSSRPGIRVVLVRKG